MIIEKVTLEDLVFEYHRTGKILRTHFPNKKGKFVMNGKLIEYSIDDGNIEVSATDAPVVPQSMTTSETRIAISKGIVKQILIVLLIFLPFLMLVISAGSGLTCLILGKE